MKILLLIFIFVIGTITSTLSQTNSPWVDEMSSISNIGDKFRQVLGPTNNAGSHNGEMCYNVAGNYVDEEYYSFESEQLDLLLWSEVSVEFTIESNIRTNDQFAFWYYDAAVADWSGFDLSNLTGTYTVTIPTSTTYISFDLSTISSNGGLNGKFAHVDRIVLNDPAQALPVELISFTARLENNINLIEWSTASENNSERFDLEQSSNGVNWRLINSTPSSGNSTQLIHYTYTDNFPSHIINYYRLVQYDFDGEFEIFGPIAVDNRKREKRIVKYVSLSGQEIDPTSTTGLVIGILDNGTTVKVYL
tara:strand:+ start:56 stop:973 length:918 start_codon:yes stop_codon:yes gene_type:complete